jgi:hypothetical protein
LARLWFDFIGQLMSFYFIHNKKTGTLEILYPKT